MNEWRILLPGRFDTERECLEKLSYWQEHYSAQNPDTSPAARRWVELAQCVSSDDSRLK